MLLLWQTRGARPLACQRPRRQHLHECVDLSADLVEEARSSSPRVNPPGWPSREVPEATPELEVHD